MCDPADVACKLAKLQTKDPQFHAAAKAAALGIMHQPTYGQPQGNNYVGLDQSLVRITEPVYLFCLLLYQCIFSFIIVFFESFTVRGPVHAFPAVQTSQIFFIYSGSNTPCR